MKYKMMIVDDERITRQGILKSCNWENEGIEQVIEAANGKDALELFNTYHPEIILSDVRMPKMDGLEFCEKVLEMDSDVKIIIMSGYDDFQYIQTAMSLGAFNYLLKPVRLSDVLPIIKKAIAIIEKKRMKMIQEEELYSQLQDSKRLLRHKLVNSLLNGLSFSADNAIIEKCKFLDINFQNKYFVTSVVEFIQFGDFDECNGEKDCDTIMFAIKDIIIEILGQTYPVIFESHLWQLAIIFNLDNPQNYEIKDLMQECLKKISQDLKFTLSVGIGEIYEGLSGICKSYREALKAVRCKSYINENRVTHINDINNCAEKESYPYQEQTEIMRLLMQNDFEGAIKAVNGFIDYFEQKNTYPISYIKLCCTGMLFVVFSNVIDEYYDINIDNEYRIIFEIEEQNTIDEVRNFVVDIMMNIFSAISQNRKIEVKKVVDDAKRYISENIESDVSLTNVSKHVFLSPNYFSYLFKQEVGESFSEYVMGQRVEKAKHLLRNTENKIYEIGGMVGYRDSRYFSQIFKRFVQMTPSEYREYFRDRVSI